MNGMMKLVPNKDGTYDLLIQWDNTDTEFAMDFFSWGKEKENRQSVSEFLAENKKNIKINTVKILVAGLVVASIPFTSFISASAAGDDSKYSMSYLYAGTPQQHIEYVARTNNSLQTVSPSYFDIHPDGSLKLNPVSQELIDQMHRNDIKVVPFLSNHWDREAGIKALADVETLSDQISDYVEYYNLDGVNVDIENVTHAERGQYTELVRLLRQKIPAHKEVSVAVAANPKNWQTGWHGSYDYAALGEASDYLMMMTYDEHYQGGNPGPVASIQFVENSIKYALSQTSADKIVVGLPFFGRIWSMDNNSVVGQGVGVSTINSMVKEYNGTITFDEESQSPKAEFEVKEGDKQFLAGGKALMPGNYVVWYEDEQSMQAKMNLIHKYDLKGAGSWALGQEDTAIWNNYNSWLNGEETSVTPPTYPSPQPSALADHPGWMHDSVGWWLKTGENTYAKKQWILINNTWYYFNADGYMAIGWLAYNGKWYFLKENGDMATGWISAGDNKYFLNESGEMITGWLFDNDNWYFLNKDGDMAIGWVLYNNKWYFTQENGVMAKGWISTGGKKYFLNESGEMITGWLFDNNNWYFLNPNGDMTIGWLVYNNKWYFLNENGSMAKGWASINGKQYFFNENGDMATGWIYDNDTWYFLNKDGDMARGWVLDKNTWYYLAESGEMNTEPLVYQGKEYLFQPNGACINP